jgi:hypothetical protein
MPAIQQSQSRRRQIIRACKARRAWTLQPAALEGMEAFLQSNDDLDMLFQLLDPHMQGKKTITADIVEASLGYDEYEDDDDDEEPHQHRRGGASRQPLSRVAQSRSGDRHHGGRGVHKSSSSNSSRNAAGGPSSTDSSNLTVVSAFDCPKLVYHNLKKNFQVQEKKWSLFGTAEDKVRPLE